jgi:hypothetical protein
MGKNYSSDDSKSSDEFSSVEVKKNKALPTAVWHSFRTYNFYNKKNSIQRHIGGIK